MSDQQKLKATPDTVSGKEKALFTGGGMRSGIWLSIGHRSALHHAMGEACTPLAKGGTMSTYHR